MAATDLVYQVGADTSKFDFAMSRVRDSSDNATGRMLNSFQKAGNGINQSMTSSAQSIDKVNASTTTATQSVSGMESAVNGLVTGIAVLEASGIIVKRLGEAIFNAQKRVEALLEIAAGSQAAGVGTTMFQSLTAQAKDLGIEVGVMTKILNTARESATVRIGEGTGQNASAFGNQLTRHVEAGNLTAQDRAPYDAATDQTARITAVLDLMDKLRAAQMNLAAQDLGKTFFGPDFERLSAVGIDLVGALRKSIEGLQVAGGVRIASPEEVERVRQLNEGMKAVNNQWTRILAQPLTDIAYAQDLMAKSALLWQQRVAGVAENFTTLYAVVRANMVAIKEAGQYLGILSADFEDPKQRDKGQKNEPMDITVNPKKDKSKPIPKLGGAAETEDVDAVENYIRQLSRARDVAQAELDTVGKTNLEREKALALARAEAAARDDFEKGRRDAPKLDDDEKSRVLATAEATARLTDRQKDLNQALQQNAEAMRTFGQMGADALADMLLEGKSLNDVLSSITKTLARSALQAAFTGQGCLGGIAGAGGQTIMINIEGISGERSEHHAGPGLDPALDRRRLVPRGRDARLVRRQGHAAPAPELRSGRASA